MSEYGVMETYQWCGLMFPILLLLNGMTSCPNYEKDIEKINKSMENRQFAEN